MKTIAISDLHGLLPEIVEPADIMFICGDISPLHIQFNKPEMWKWLTGEFMDWIIGLPVEKVYLVAGNHDAFFEGASTSKKVELLFLSSHKLIYLENELVYYVDNDGITWSIFGTPYCHQYGNWPFMRTDEYMEEKFKEIPDEVNFILTHDAPYG
jgi:predicted phosphohydrolase